MTVRVHFVCHGNICRSAMAERVARAWFAREGLDAIVDSSGVSDEEHGNPLDPRARRVLERHGYEATGHRARQASATLLADADLIVIAEPHQRRPIARLAPPLAEVRLLTDFDPDAELGSGVPDPWYGPESGFEATLAVIEAAMPGIVGWVRGDRQPIG